LVCFGNKLNYKMKFFRKLLNLSDSPKSRQLLMIDPYLSFTDLPDRAQNTIESHEQNITNALNIDVDFYFNLMMNKKLKSPLLPTDSF